MRGQWTIAVTGIALCCLLVGCTDTPASESATATPSATSASTSTADADQVLKDTIQNIQAAGSMRFRSQGEFTDPSETMTWKTAGGWMYHPRSWQQAVVSVRPQTDRAIVKGGEIKGSLLYVNGRTYSRSNLGGSPEWVDVTSYPTTGLEMVALPSPSPVPVPVSALYAMHATSVKSVSNYTLISGSIPNVYASQILGVGYYLDSAGWKGQYEGGRTAVLLQIDSMGLPMSLAIYGSDMDFSSGDVPQYVAETVGTAALKVSYSGFGKVQPYQAPRHTAATL